MPAGDAATSAHLTAVQQALSTVTAAQVYALPAPAGRHRLLVSAEPMALPRVSGRPWRLSVREILRVLRAPGGAGHGNGLSVPAR